MDISIIIVNYNSDKLLFNCINSIINNIVNIDYEIVVVDNKSSDNSLNLCKSICDKRLKIIESSSNLGFSKANNIGVKNSTGKMLHFLNPDTEIDSNFVDDYLRVIEDSHKNICKVYVNPMRDSNGFVYYGKNFIPESLNYLTYLLNRSRTKWYYIGATIIMSREIFNIIGGWNDRFFMYGEDADIFYRINEHNISIEELPTLIFHYGGGTSKSAFSSMEREILIQKSLRIFYNSNNLCGLNYVLFQIMMVLSFIRKPRRAWWQVRAIINSFK